MPVKFINMTNWLTVKDLGQRGEITGTSSELSLFLKKKRYRSLVALERKSKFEIERESSNDIEMPKTTGIWRGPKIYF